MGPRRLRAARRARRRLSFAGWLVGAEGVLIALVAALLAPFLFPFGLAGGALAILAGRQLVGLRGVIGAVLAAGAGLVAGTAAGLVAAGHPEERWLAGSLAACLGLLGLAVLGIVWFDAGYLPSAPGPESD